MRLRLPAGVLGAVILHDGGDAALAHGLAGKSLDQALRFLFLTRRTLADDFLENAASAFRITHVHVGSRQIQLGPNFAHGHRLHFRNASSWVLILLVRVAEVAEIARSL